MHDRRLKSDPDGRDRSEDIWAVDFTAHPLLDPEFPEQRSRLLNLGRDVFSRMRIDNGAYRQVLLRYFHPSSPPPSSDITLANLTELASQYLLEADIYLASAMNLLPIESRRAVVPLPDVCACNDVRDLISMAFQGSSPRLRYEARRKLFLAQTLLHIDQSRVIQDGPRHLTYFENILSEGLWADTRQIHDLRIGFHVEPTGQSINYTSRPGDTDRCLDFHSTFIEKAHGERRVSLDVLYYNCRFKRSVTNITIEEVDGVERVLERPRWGEMRTASSGSILSKMIRKGINQPDEIDDLIGAMFIVNDNDALNDLLLLLDTCLGSPFGWRNVTDTLAAHPNGTTLNRYSSKEFKVFKGDVDILYPGNDKSVAPYRFPVEIQIFTLEGYLRTVCSTHEASHRALKLRQFLYGLVPRIFPRLIYGDDWLVLDGDQAGRPSPRPADGPNSGEPSQE